MSSRAQSIGPPIAVLTGCSRRCSSVATPKLPPPPRRAQNRSGSLRASACTRRPSARTTSAPRRLSTASPCARFRYPMPPESVNPPIPTVETVASGVASPCAWVARSTSPASVPPLTLALWVCLSTRTSRIALRSITRPPSALAKSALCAPARIASSKPFSRPKRMALATSSGSAQRAITAGSGSNIRLTTCRACSYAGEAGPIAAAPKHHVERLGQSPGVGCHRHESHGRTPELRRASARTLKSWRDSVGAA